MKPEPEQFPILFGENMVLANRRLIKTQTRHVVTAPFDLPSSLHQMEKPPICGRIGDHGFGAIVGDKFIQCPYGGAGDILWVKETFFDFSRFKNKPTFSQCSGTIAYRADGTSIGRHRWTPAIFMPRSAARLFLLRTATRIERLQTISEEDTRAEGVEMVINRPVVLWRNYQERTIPFKPKATAIESYRSLWNSTNLKPKPVYAGGVPGKGHIIAYVSYPWSMEDFDRAHPHVTGHKTPAWRGLPLTVTPNPYVWVISYQRIQSPDMPFHADEFREVSAPV